MNANTAVARLRIEEGVEVVAAKSGEHSGDERLIQAANDFDRLLRECVEGTVAQLQLTVVVDEGLITALVEQITHDC
jgi:hypothetical protein